MRERQPICHALPSGGDSPVAFDVFISYASKDKLVADAVCARLEASAIRCWIAPRDIVPGTSYGEAIIEAIHTAKVMVLVFSSNANFSAHIPKEVERAVSSGLTILPFRIEDVAPGKSLDYFIGSVHWLDAMTPPMEKHLDDLATTVRKLIPGNADSAGAEVSPPQAAWQKSAPPMTTVRPPNRAATPRDSSSKNMWIGIAAVAVLVAIVSGIVLLRGGGNPQSAQDLPNTAIPPASQILKSDPVVVSKPDLPKPAPSPASTVLKPRADAIVGCYQWFNNAPVEIRSDGTIFGGGFTGHWRLVNSARRAYTFTWPEAIDTVTISPDQRSLSGANQYGYPASGIRVAGNTGLVGIWRWPNGVPITVSPDGSFTAVSFRGKWQAIDASRGIYTLTWPNPVDSVTLLPDGSRVSGANQYGIAISGARTQPCFVN
jgi:TIR domain